MSKKKDNLKQALESLPTYEPSEKVWDKIADDLYDADIANALPKMKLLEPSEKVWDNLEKELENKNKIHYLNAKTFHPWRWGIAASIAFLIGLFTWNYYQVTDYDYNYSEILVPSDDPNRWKNNQEEEELIVELCEGRPPVCETPEFMNLEKELAFLKTSKIDIMAQMSPYDDNAHLEIMLTQIEIERATIAQQMVDLLI